jgi:hypothetical protein
MTSPRRTSAPAPTAVVHLVRHANGLEPFERFMASYERFGAELEHDLVLLFKGFPDRAATAPYVERAAGHAPSVVEVSDEGFDMTAYLAAARALSHRRLCFVNSFSEVRVAGWLRLLDAALTVPGTGAAGASGSWGSHLSYNLWQLGFTAAYGEVFESRTATRRALQERSGVAERPRPLQWAVTLANTVLDTPAMSRFPAVHLRTNAFLIDAELFRSLRWGGLGSKRATYRMESGRRGVTAQIRARGRQVVVVDRHGVARAPADWPEGDVFWQKGQEDLLVSDNQTRDYDEATPVQREVLSRYAWGARGRPT